MPVDGVDERDELGASMLEQIRRNAEHRLREIEPLIEEADRLRDVLAVIARRGIDGEGSDGGHADGQAQDGGERAARGANKRMILELVESHPGIRAAEIAELTGLKRTVVASTVSRLKRQGALLEHAQGGVCLAGPHGGARRPETPERAATERVQLARRARGRRPRTEPAQLRSV